MNEFFSNALFKPRTTLVASLIRLLVCFLLVATVSGLGAAATYPQIPTWYAGLAKPEWTPPNSAFPIVWTVLYALMGMALWRLWDRAPETPMRGRAIRLFLLQLALNALWSPVFFGLHALVGGLVIIVALVLALVATLRAASLADDVAGWLLVPYVPWVLYAAALNGALVYLN